MSPDLTAEFAHLETRADAFVGRIRSYSPQVQAAPVGKSYSPLKALEHMFLVDRSYVEFAAKFDKTKSGGKPGKPSFIYRYVLRSLAKPSNFASPTLKRFEPENAMPLEEAANKWRDERAKLVAYLENFDDNEAALKHPFFGLLSPRDMFILSEKHLDYHGLRLPTESL